jgi:hypothetical protein
MKVCQTWSGAGWRASVRYRSQSEKAILVQEHFSFIASSQSCMQERKSQSKSHSKGTWSCRRERERKAGWVNSVILGLQHGDERP